MKLDKFTVGRRYAKALYDFAKDNDEVAQVYDELNSLQEIMQADPEVPNLLSDARLDLNQKREILAILKQPFSQSLQNFMDLVFEYKRFYDIELIISYFDDIYNQAKGFAEGEAITSVPLDNEQTERLSAAYANRFGLKKLRIKNSIDPKIIGGVIVRSQNRVIDGSIRTRLEQLKKDLVNN